MRLRLSGALALALLPSLAGAAATQILPLSGMGEAGEKPVYWDFKLDGGRGSGKWAKIPVPSCWEQQGFGAYYYGTQGRGKPDDDPVIPKETGTYRRSFQIPSDWKGREIHIMFEAAMTDTRVSINGQSAGPVHQGGFYRFDYDITKLVKTGRNEIEVRVAKESSNGSVNRAERRGDYWTFGGIYRPVWLEARPFDHITWTAIDARADGSFYARVNLNHAAPADARVQAQLFDAAGKPFGAVLDSGAVSGETAIVKGSFGAPALWTAETPHRYSVKFSLRHAGESIHELEQHFGFRSIEVRANDGVYLNGRRIVLKGINRHSFNPQTGRTLTRAQNYADVRLIKAANMNAVRMSHYPPDPSFLEAADELGLYVLDELAGWQDFYDAPTGARLVGQIVRRDVNHPSIVFWDNGNEGGWNRENDGEFDRWDPQRRAVLHPWAIHSGINTDHYENYDSTVNLSRGPEIFMPTEFLHGLYDGGIGAGFRDYWDVMGRSPTVAGGFFWAFADEGVARSDRNGRIDNMGNAAPDGIVGAHHEKEGSFFAVKEIWSPVEVRDLAFADGTLSMRVENRYDFTDLSHCSLRWRAIRLPAPGGAAAKLLSQGTTRGPALPPGASTSWRLPLPFRALESNEVIELSVIDATGAELWKWVIEGNEPAPQVSANKLPGAHREGDEVTAGRYSLTFDPATGEVVRISDGAAHIALRGPRPVAWLRTPKTRGFDDIAGVTKLRTLELAPGDAGGVLARVSYDGPLRSVIWRATGSGLAMQYEIAFDGPADILGVRFAPPSGDLVAKRWVGAGPYRIWNNRQAGTEFGLHTTNYSLSVPGESYHYPEFEGFFGKWRWLQLQTRDTRVAIRNDGNVPFFALYRPAPGVNPILELPDMGWSFLHAIPSIGTKFAPAEVLGPQSQPRQMSGVIRGELIFDLSAP
ncbi:MAG: glycoside hydrolase family 2 TIM barrel-domain containing protein [Pseudomonadota bacterium]